MVTHIGTILGEYHIANIGKRQLDNIGPISVICWRKLANVTTTFDIAEQYGRCAFAATAPATWNSWSDELRNPDLHSATFRRNLKTFLFRQYRVH